MKVKKNITHRWEISWRVCASFNYSNILTLSHLNILPWLHLLHVIEERDQIHSFSAGRPDGQYGSGSAKLGTCLNKGSDPCLVSHSSVAMGSCYRALQSSNWTSGKPVSLWDCQKSFFQSVFEVCFSENSVRRAQCWKQFDWFLRVLVSPRGPQPAVPQRGVLLLLWFNESLSRDSCSFCRVGLLTIAVLKCGVLLRI